MASARIGGYECELLRLPSGASPREACLQVTPDLLAGLWKAIRDFEPDYLFCPPFPGDPLAGIHVDHVAVAEAVRKVAYMINVPHAFTPEFPDDETKPSRAKSQSSSTFMTAICVAVTGSILWSMSNKPSPKFVKWPSAINRK